MFILKLILGWLIVIFTVLPIISIPLVLLNILHFIVTKILRNILKRDLIPINNGSEASFLTDEIWTSPKNTVGFVHILEGKVDENEIKVKFYQTLFSGNNRGCYSDRLTSLVPKSWLGFGFWEKINEPFDIFNHFKVLKIDKTKSEFERSDFNETIRAWMQDPFKRNCPLWDVILIIGDDFSVFGFRVHHIIGDAYSILQFFDRLFDHSLQKTNDSKIAQAKDHLFIKDLKRKITTILYAPIVFIKCFKLMICSRDYFSSKKTCQDAYFTKVKFPLAKIKELKRIYNSDSNQVSKTKIPLANVLISCFSQSLKKVFQNGFEMTNHKESEISQIKIALSLPEENEPHPYGVFCNHWSFEFYTVPIGKDDNLNLIRNDLEKLKKMNLNRVVSLLMRTYVIIPSFILKFGLRFLNGISIGYSNMPGPSSSRSFCNHKIEDIYFILGMQIQNSSIALSSFSYDGHMTVTLMGNRETFKSEFLCEKVLDGLNEEIERQIHEII